MRSARKTLVDFAFVLGGKFSSLTVVILGGMLIARTAGPAEYGSFAVAISLVLLGDGLLGGPLDLAAVRFFALHPDEEDRVRRFEAMTLQVKGILAAIAFVGILACRPLLALRWPAVADPTFPLMTCGFALTALLTARSTATCLQNRRQFRLYSAADFVQGIVRAGGFLVLAWFGRASAASFILVYGLAAVGVTVAGWLFLGQRHLLGRWPGGQDAMRLFRYFGYVAGIITLATLTGRGDLLLLGLQKGTSGSAAYGLASQIAQLLTQVAMYASVLTQPRVLALDRQGRLRGLFRLNLAVIGCLGILMLVLWNPATISQGILTAFGPGFAASVPLLRTLLVGVLLDWLMMPLLVVYCLQACPREAFFGEGVITALFLTAATAAVAGSWPWPVEQMLAQIAVLGRVAKVMLYGGLFLRHAAPRPVGAEVIARPDLP